MRVFRVKQESDQRRCDDKSKRSGSCKEGAIAQEGRPHLEAERGKEADSLLRPPEGTGLANTFSTPRLISDF